MKEFAFLFYPGDYLRDTQTLSEKSQVAYDRIMCEHMRNICITQRQLNFFTKRLTPEEAEELMFVLCKIEGGYQIGWIADSINKRRAYSESRRKNRTSKPKEDMNNISKTYDEHMEKEIEIEKVIVEEDEQEIEILDALDFSVFWDMYDKKIGKDKCSSKWDKLTRQEKEDAIRYIPDYKDAQPDKQFRQHPLTYLNNKKWNDEIIQATNGNKKGPRKWNFTEEHLRIDPQ